MCVGGGLWRSEDDSQELVLSFYRVSPEILNLDGQASQQTHYLRGP